MNLDKSLEFFNPMSVNKPIHVIGVGAIGSNLVDMLVRLGLTNIHLYDFDTVDPHNIANQRFTTKHLGMAKVDAVYVQAKEINPAVTVTLHPKGYVDGTKLSGYVFLAVDSIELRSDIVKAQRYNPMILAMFDFRMVLASAQHYATRWNQPEIERFLDSMNFTSEEAKIATPVSACGTTLSVLPTVNIICSAGIANFINLIKSNKLESLILIDAFAHDTFIVPQ